MKMIVGLGNPGPRYQYTRHNIGFMAVDGLARRLDTEIKNIKFKSLYTKKGDLILVKPQTFMNLSGEAVVPFLNYFKLEPQDLMVVYDDMDLPLGQIRIRPKGSGGGHNGMGSIIKLLGRDDFPRLRIGIGRPNPMQSNADYVLRIFEKDEMPSVTEALIKAVDALETWVNDGLDTAMNKYNQRA